jgi:hypothetical protein
VPASDHHGVSGRLLAEYGRKEEELAGGVALEFGQVENIHAKLYGAAVGDFVLDGCREKDKIVDRRVNVRLVKPGPRLARISARPVGYDTKALNLWLCELHRTLLGRCLARRDVGAQWIAHDAGLLRDKGVFVVGCAVSLATVIGYLRVG